MGKETKKPFGLGCGLSVVAAIVVLLVFPKDFAANTVAYAILLFLALLVVRFLARDFYARWGQYLWIALWGISLLSSYRLSTKVQNADPDLAGEISSGGTATVASLPESPKENVEDILKELDGLVGLEEVKAEVRRIVNLVKINEARRKQGLKVPPMSYHMVFTGNPGTGKTTVARIMARAFVALGIIRNPTLVEVDRSGLVGRYQGETAQKTNQKINDALGIPQKVDKSGRPVERTAKEAEEAYSRAPGGVLFVDEAYQLVEGENDEYGREAIATLLKRMEDNRDKLVVIAAGYTDDMRDFLDANAGLKSRFAHTLNFADYTAAELAMIFRSMVARNQFKMSDDLAAGLDGVIAKLTKTRDRTFGNARFVRQLFEDATGRQANRLAASGQLEGDALVTLTLEDVQPKNKPKDLRAPSIEEVLAELDGLTGMASVKAEVRKLVASCRVNRLREEKGLENTVVQSYNFVFSGNPGTGKTTVARILGRAFQALGLLSRGNFVETDRSGLVAKYKGQTAIKTNKIIDSAMGGVLFIDEAYQLNQGASDDYGHEAVATLLKRMEDARGSLVVIVAGYTDDMKRFMDLNPGLESRFNRRLNFPDFTNKELASIFRSMAKKGHYTLSADVEKWLEPFIGVRAGKRGKSFGNARWARNLFEKAVERQALRVVEIKDVSSEELLTLRMKDVGIVLKDPDASQED